MVIVVIGLPLHLLHRVAARQALTVWRQHRIEVRSADKVSIAVLGERFAIDGYDDLGIVLLELSLNH